MKTPPEGPPTIGQLIYYLKPVERDLDPKADNQALNRALNAANKGFNGHISTQIVGTELFLDPDKGVFGLIVRVASPRGEILEFDAHLVKELNRVGLILTEAPGPDVKAKRAPWWKFWERAGSTRKLRK